MNAAPEDGPRLGDDGVRLIAHCLVLVHRRREAEVAEAPEATEKKPRGLGVGALARQLLMDPAGFPHALIAEMVNAQIDGAATTDKSVRWYANDMRKKGVEVPPRQKHHPADMDEEQSAEALSTVRVVEPADD